MAITKSNDKSITEKSIYIIDFKSNDQRKNEEALQSFKTLFAAISTKMVDDQAGNHNDVEIFNQVLIY